MPNPMHHCSKNLCNSSTIKSDGIFDKIRSIYMDQKQKNNSFHECPSVQFKDDCFHLKERFILLLTSYSPFTMEMTEDEFFKDEQWKTFERILRIGINNFGFKNVERILETIYWDSQIENIWKNLPHLKQ